MLISVVTDNELFASQIVKTIFLIIIVSAIIFNVFRFFQHQTNQKKSINITAFLILIIVLYFVFNAYRIEGNLLNNPVFTNGITLGHCTKFALGEGVEFEYELDGIKYTNCNTFHPISLDSIIVSGGKYKVRVPRKYPNEGRMDFTSPIY